MSNLLKRWLDPSIPTGSVGFTVIQAFGLVLEGVLRPRIWAADLAVKTLLTACMMLVFAIMAIATTKRLVDVCWSRWWTVLIGGFVLLDALSALHAKTSPLLIFVAILCAVLCLGYLGLVFVLVFERPSGGRGPRVRRSAKCKTVSSASPWLANN